MRFEERDNRSLVLWAAGCAEHVLRHFEEKHPKDNRPRDAVDEAGRAWVCGEIATSARPRARPIKPRTAPPVTPPQPPTLRVTPQGAARRPLTSCLVDASAWIG